MIITEQINVIVNCIIEAENPDLVILFGSYAYGQPDENSDTDLLVIKDTDLSFYDRLLNTDELLFTRKVMIPCDILM